MPRPLPIRRGIERAKEVCAIQDGAEWIQGFVNGHRHDALRILDFAHAAGYVSEIADKVREAGGHLPAKWVDGVLHRLKHDGPERVLRHLSRFLKRYPQSLRTGHLLTKAMRPDALSDLSTARLADWVWQRRKWS